MTELPNKVTSCTNCGELLQGAFCHTCGQSIHGSSRYIGTILVELMDNLFSYDSRIYRTLIPLMFRPGYVCNEYLAGKRASFLPPFRLYLFASVIFFLLVPLVNDISVVINNDPGDAVSLTGEPQEDIAGVIALDKDDSQLGIVGIKEDLSDVDRSYSFLLKQRKKLRDNFEKITAANSVELAKTSLNTLPTMMFFLLPLLALFLKLFYLFSNRYYMEHLIVVLYSQSFMFFMLLFAISFEKSLDLMASAVPNWILFNTLVSVAVTLCYLWIPLHLFLFIKNVYQQSMPMTLLKYCLVSLSYIGLISAAVIVAVIWGVYNI